MPFLFGSSQFVNNLSNSSIHPSNAHEQSITHNPLITNQFLYIDALKFVQTIKQGPSFAETSPVLYSISSVPNWSKVNGGMIKMYKAEVLGKQPVVQHFDFGQILKFK